MSMGLDRQHMVPANRRRGLPARPKKAYATEADAWEFVRAHRFNNTPRGADVYRCETCGQWHVGTGYRLGDPRRREG